MYTFEFYSTYCFGESIGRIQLGAAESNEVEEGDIIVS